MTRGCCPAGLQRIGDGGRDGADQGLFLLGSRPSMIRMWAIGMGAASCAILQMKLTDNEPRCS
jgi:hypothetical protein